ncbi:MAG: hypothetical protein ABI639_02565 [Thermoanaerobaculia bacterium]
MIVDRISRFLSDPAAEPFEALALAAFAFQVENLKPYRAVCERSGRVPSAVTSWREIPLIPATAFASMELATGAPLEIFRSSGTLSSSRSVHHHPFPDLYRAAIDASFPRFALGGDSGARPPMLALVPPRAIAPDSSLGFMVEHLVSRYGGPGSDYAFAARGVEGAKARSWFGARQREGRPVMVLATSIALADLLDFLARIDLKFRLPAGSVLFETGGLKGRERELSPEDLHARLATQLGLAGEAIVTEYGMTELTSQAYASSAGGDPGLFLLPHWMRVRALDPVSLAELPAGEVGLLAFFDLANVGSALHLLTEDLGSVDGGGEGDGFRLAGRAPQADLRGCSLLAEELGRASE